MFTGVERHNKLCYRSLVFCKGQRQRITHRSSCDVHIPGGVQDRAGWGLGCPCPRQGLEQEDLRGSWQPKTFSSSVVPGYKELRLRAVPMAAPSPALCSGLLLPRAPPAQLPRGFVPAHSSQHHPMLWRCSWERSCAWGGCLPLSSLAPLSKHSKMKTFLYPGGSIFHHLRAASTKNNSAES